MTTTFKCIAKRMTGGQRHEHLSQLWWVKCIDGRETTEGGSSSRDQMVSFIEKMEIRLFGAQTRIHNARAHGYTLIIMAQLNTSGRSPMDVGPTTC